MHRSHVFQPFVSPGEVVSDEACQCEGSQVLQRWSQPCRHDGHGVGKLKLIYLRWGEDVMTHVDEADGGGARVDGRLAEAGLVGRPQLVAEEGAGVDDGVALGDPALRRVARHILWAQWWHWLHAAAIL